MGDGEGVYLLPGMLCGSGGDGEGVDPGSWGWAWRGVNGEQGVSAHRDGDGGVLVRGCSQGWAGDTAVFVIRV